MTDEINPGELQEMQPPLNLPADPLADERARLQAKYGFAPVVDDFFDAMAQQILEQFQVEPGRGMAGVNHLDDDRTQTFVGVAGGGLREMTCFQGACSTLITRRTVKGRTALAMSNLMDFPLFATNDMVTQFGMGTYLGAQIIAPEGVPIGTVWWIDTEPTRWRQVHLDYMKGQADKAMQHLIDRQPQ